MWWEVFLLVFALLLLYKSNLKPSHYPPGTFGWPVIGNLPPSNKRMSVHLKEMREKYGDIFTTKWGSFPVVFIATHQLVKKAFNNPDIQGRLDLHSFKLFNGLREGGILLADGITWLENRRFMLRHLKEYLGVSKTSLEVSIQDEAATLVKYLEKMDLRKPVAIDWSINVSVLNVIWQILASKRFEPDDQMVITFTDSMNEDIQIMQGPIFLFDILPWLRKIVPSSIFNKITKGDTLLRHRNEFFELAMETIEEHEKTLDPSNPRDVIDSYLLEMKNENASEFKRSYSDLLVTMNDMFLAGSETAANTLRWMVLYMARYPEIQKKVHDAIDARVPKDRLPSLNDRQSLQYLDAVILEVSRSSSLVPIGVAHVVTSETTFESYTLPKGTIAFANLELIHRDPKVWERPNEFRPENFLKEDGTLDSKKDGFVPFSLGRRQCLGESLARVELYLFASAILQRFTIRAPIGVKLDLETDPEKFLLNQPKSFEVMLEKRI